jgi:hypothetical protein
MKVKFFVVIWLLAFSGAGLIWHLTQRMPSAIASTEIGNSQSVASKQSKATSSKLFLWLPARPNIAKRLSEDIPMVQPQPDAGSDIVAKAMLPLAEQGSAEAMRYLAEALQKCAGVDHSNDTDFESQQIDLQIQYEDAVEKIGTAIDASELARNVAKATIKRKALQGACAKLDNSQISSWLKWMERSALAGDINAKRDYSTAAFEEFREQDISLSNLDEVVRRRNLVQQFSNDLLASGDCNALNSLQSVTSDPVQAYTYRVALLRYIKDITTVQGGDLGNYADLEGYLSGQAANFSPAQIDEINNGVDFIMQNYCGG